MNFHIRFLSLNRAAFILAFLAASAMAQGASSVGKVRYILGEVTVQKKAGESWNPLRIGLKVKSNDLIRTLVESEAGIALSDGSLITIEENTTIRFETAVNNQNESGTTVDLRKGRVFFDIQKQKDGHKFEFRTGTATAAIRGTNGFIESGTKGIIVSLESGKMLVTGRDGKALEVLGGETLVEEKGKGLQKFKTPSSGTKGLAKEIASEKKSGTFSASTLKENSGKLDEKNKAALDSLSKASPCEFDAIPSKTTSPEIPVSGKCKPDIRVQVNGIEAKLSDGGRFLSAVSFGKESYGTKRIRVKCSIGDAEMLCHEAFAEYVHASLNDGNAFIRLEKIDIPSASGEISVKGEFFSEDPAAIVTVTFGNFTSKNLNVPNANGRFAIAIPETAEQGESIVTATLATKKGTQKDSIQIPFPPKIRIISESEEKCEISFSLSGTRGRNVQVEELVDGIPATKATFSKDISLAIFPMLPGKHRYKLLATDENGNRSEASKTLVCKE